MQTLQQLDQWLGTKVAAAVGWGLSRMGLRDLHHRQTIQKEDDVPNQNMPNQNMPNQNLNPGKQGSAKQNKGRGFAGMDPRQQREIASEGGRAAHASGHAHEFTSEQARQAGRKGGEARSQSRINGTANQTASSGNLRGGDHGARS